MGIAMVVSIVACTPFTAECSIGIANETETVITAVCIGRGRRSGKKMLSAVLSRVREVNIPKLHTDQLKM